MRDCEDASFGVTATVPDGVRLSLSWRQLPPRRVSFVSHRHDIAIQVSGFRLATLAGAINLVH